MLVQVYIYIYIYIYIYSFLAVTALNHQHIGHFAASLALAFQPGYMGQPSLSSLYGEISSFENSVGKDNSCQPDQPKRNRVGEEKSPKKSQLVTWYAADSL